MKQIIFLLFIALLTVNASAQKNLHVSPLFSGEYDRNENAIVVIVKGKKLEPYRLTLFHSISVNQSESDVSRFEKAVLKDAQSADDSQIIKAGNQIAACYYQLPPAQNDQDGPNRFILFKKTAKDAAILIYLEGRTQLDDLIKRFMTPQKNK